MHTSSQKLFKVGKPEELEREINIEVIKGSIMLDIKDDDSVYTVESNFDNVIENISERNNPIQKYFQINTPGNYNMNKYYRL